MIAKTTSDAGLAATGETMDVAIPAQEQDGARGPTHPLPSGDPHTRLQEILPEIRELAQRVGGLKQLQELIATLTEINE